VLGDLAKITEELAPLKDNPAKTNLKSQKLAESNLNAVFRVQALHLRVAGIFCRPLAGGKELKGKLAQWEQDTLRKQLRETPVGNLSGEDARRVLAALDWFWATQFQLYYRPADLELSALQRQQNVLPLGARRRSNRSAGRPHARGDIHSVRSSL